ncbi:MAG: YkgJ family cysteine cluster protein [Deltaproteobacteria bacterium]|nr:YkgJ family cysteine cluster protein [Deltaproteobacteria bacterium]
MCHDCYASCCTMPLEITANDLVRLGIITEYDAEEPRKIAKVLKKQGIIKHYRDKAGIFTMQPKAGGDCQFLDENRRCSVYENRPDVCREFPKVSSRPGYCPYIRKK